MRGVAQADSGSALDVGRRVLACVPTLTFQYFQTSSKGKNGRWHLRL